MIYFLGQMSNLRKAYDKNIMYQLWKGASRDRAVTNRDKQGQSLSAPACPYLSLLVRVRLCRSLYVPVISACPCLSLSVLVSPCLFLSLPVCSCLSLLVPVCLYICYTCIPPPADEYHSLHQYEQATVPKHANLIFNSLFFFTFDLAFSRTLSFNPKSST